jgi:hypothetical protein
VQFVLEDMYRITTKVKGTPQPLVVKFTSKATKRFISLPYYSVLNDKIEKIAAYQSEVKFDLSISNLGDLAIPHPIPHAIPHAIVSVNKLFKLFYTIHYDILCSISMTK